jgi:hypothetical protein
VSLVPRPLRTVAYLVIALLATAWIAVRQAPPPLVPELDRDVTVERMEATLASLRASLTADPNTVILLGDSSMLEHFIIPREKTLELLLETDGPKVGLPMRVVAYNGFDPIAYYLLADVIAALHPRAVVLTANLQAFTDDWFSHSEMKHPQLAAYVRPTRAFQAMSLSLDLAGISNSSLAVKPLLRLFGASEVPEILDGYRKRFRATLDGMLSRRPTAAASLATTIAAALNGSRFDSAVAAAAEGAPAPRPTSGGANPPVPGRPSGRQPVPGQLTMRSAFRRLDLYPFHLKREQASVRVLEATVRDLVASSVRTFVLVTPLHLNALKLTGAYQRRDIEGALALIRDVTVTSGATPIDLSQALPDEDYFTDELTHFSVEGNRIVAARLIAELTRALAPSP